jgi:hypothetical protein
VDGLGLDGRDEEEGECEDEDGRDAVGKEDLWKDETDQRAWLACGLDERLSERR